MRALLIFLLPLLILDSSARADETAARFSPQLFSGPRGDEPRGQALVEVNSRWESADSLFLAHLQVETLGRRDLSFDLDRAWYRARFGQSSLFFGRIHPWEVSQAPDARRPWGYLAQLQARNHAVNLGLDREASAMPEPVLLGWVGLHYWSSDESAFQWGISATPLFIPTLGSEVSFSDQEETDVGRFGRRPPGFVSVNGAQLPLRYSIDQSRILEDVLLQPQLMAQSRIQLHPKHSTWLAAGRSPSPQASQDANGFLRVSGSGVDAVALVRPSFAQLWRAQLNHEWKLSAFTLFGSIQWISDSSLGGELGGSVGNISIAVADSSHSGEIGLYTEKLLSADARLPLNESTHAYAGLKRHLSQQDLWLRAGVETSISQQVSLDLGGDLFGGSDTSYFGEWRTNDRVYLTVVQKL